MPPVRVNYYTGQRLAAADLRDEQGYQDEVRRLLHRGLFTAGVVEGLEVARADGGTAPRTVRVSPGTALDAQGRLIVLDPAVEVAVPNQPPASGTDFYYLVLRFAEEPVPGREVDCAPPGSAPAGRFRQAPALDWTEVIPYPRDPGPDDPAEQGVVIALVQLVPGDCTIAAIDPQPRRYSFPRNVSRVQAVAYEGEKDIAPGDPKKLYFHVRGGAPSAVVLYLRGDRFSPSAYTESGQHTHTLSGVAVGPTALTAQDHRHDIQHGHHVVHGNDQDGVGPDGLHTHPLLARARVSGGRPQRAIVTDDVRDALGRLISVGYYQRGWQGDINENKPPFDESYMLPPSTKVAGAGDGADGWQDAPHTHEARIVSDGPASSGTMSPAPATSTHGHPFAATVDPVGAAGVALRGGAAFTVPADVRVALDGADITSLLVGALPVTWTALGGRLGGDTTHPFNVEGTGPLDLVQLGLSLGPGEHLLELSVPPPSTGAPPTGGKVVYNLYVE